MKYIKKSLPANGRSRCLLKICGILVLITNLSCKKLVEVTPASNLILQDLVFANDKTAISAVTGLCSKMVVTNLGICNGGLSVYAGLSSDEAANTTNNPNYDPFFKNSIATDNAVISTSFWSAAYRNIYQANAILEGLQQSVSVTSTLKNQLTGEARLVRAINFFYLINLFGDVPLVLTTDYQVNAIMPRTPKIQVYDQIERDLKDAKMLMTENYQGNLRGRPNKWAAVALLSRVYLYRADWINAEAESTLVISSPLYNLETDLSKSFLNSGKEAIWQLTRETLNTAEAALFVPASATVKPTFVLSAALLAQFEDGDLRKTNWTKSNTVSNQLYTYPYKYKVRTGSAVTEDLIVLRISEQYLIRAEARAQQDKTAEAVADLNKLRARSRAVPSIAVPNPLPDLATTLLKPAVLKAVEKERRTELFLEWGHRWFDLKRTGRADEVLSSIKTGWESYAEFYPIPLLETRYNVFLTQNTGYAK